MVSSPIFLLRHGQTEWNAEGRLQGSLDSPLTELGIAQAYRMASLLKAQTGDLNWHLVSSPLGRTKQTAEIIASTCNLPVSYDARIQEVFLGSWDGLSWAQFETLAMKADPSANSFQRFSIHRMVKPMKIFWVAPNHGWQKSISRPSPYRTVYLVDYCADCTWALILIRLRIYQAVHRKACFI